MSRRTRRILIPLLVALVALGVLLAVFNAMTRSGGPPPGTAPGNGTGTASPSAGVTNGPTQDSATQPTAAVAGDQVSANGPSTAPSAAGGDTGTALAGLRAVAPASVTAGAVPRPLGSLDPRFDVMQVEFSTWGAGISRIAFSDIWKTAAAKIKAKDYLKTLQPGTAFDFTKVDERERYELVVRNPLVHNGRLSDLPVLAAWKVVINGVEINLLPQTIWSETAAGTFVTRIEDGGGRPVAEITRQYSLGVAYDMALEQRVRNLSDRPLEVRWVQYGPVDLPVDRGDYIPRQRLHLGYLPDPVNDAALVRSNDDDYVIERGTAIKRVDKAAKSQDSKKRRELLFLWPNEDSVADGWQVSWFGITNRYFGFTVHPPVRDGKPVTHSLEGSVQEIEIGKSIPPVGGELLYTTLHSPMARIEPGGERSLDMGIFAGPLDRDLLDQQPYEPLAMTGMIVFSMSGCCTFLTFQWLAHLLLNFLGLLHDYMLFDWGLAIIALVIVVRTLLHPLTKKSQINMQRFGKQMSAMKPEIDKLQKKYGGDPQKMRVEQARLMREHNINPLQMLGCLPMFLQMPIWIALWAMLYLAFDIRQEPAFYGVFQLFNNWTFLADLSTQDNFINLYNRGWNFTIPLLGFDVTAINLLPLLMGLVFYFQQKYMSPPPTPNMTPEQIQQQKIMKVMMVVLFPVMLYPAPSGLTLYIFTSSCIGILESKYIRAHIDQLDKTRPASSSPGVDGVLPGEKAKKPKDLRSRLFAEAIERAKAKRAERDRQREMKTFKKRK